MTGGGDGERSKESLYPTAEPPQTPWLEPRRESGDTRGGVQGSHPFQRQGESVAPALASSSLLLGIRLPAQRLGAAGGAAGKRHSALPAGKSTSTA